MWVYFISCLFLFLCYLTTYVLIFVGLLYFLFISCLCYQSTYVLIFVGLLYFLFISCLCYLTIKKWFIGSLRPSSYGCTREAAKHEEKRKSCTTRSGVQLWFFWVLRQPPKCIHNWMDAQLPMNHFFYNIDNILTQWIGQKNCLFLSDQITNSSESWRSDKITVKLLKHI